MPFGENIRYDLVADDGRRLSRIQCKTGRLRDGVIRFNVCSSYSHHAKPPVDAKRTYKGQIDEFAVYCPDTGPSISFRSKTSPTTRVATLRVEPARNRQIKHVRLAVMYEVARVDVY